MSTLLAVVRSAFDPVVDVTGFGAFSALTFIELVSTVSVLIAYEAHRMTGKPRNDPSMRLLRWSTGPLLLLAVMLIVYRFDRLA